MKQRAKRNEPAASRPHMPGYGIADAGSGAGLLPWGWAAERLANTHNYWLATTRHDSAPHCMPVWGIWLDDKFYFSTGTLSRKARNLASNPKCVVCTEQAKEAVIVEGVAEALHDRAMRKRFSKAYEAKYQWDMTGFKEPVYVVRPRIAFGFIEYQLTNSATRWVFDDGPRRKPKIHR